jgi:hypothetical protein
MIRILVVIVLLIVGLVTFLTFRVLPWLVGVSLLFLFFKWTGQVFVSPEFWFLSMLVICMSILFFSPKGFR